MKDKIIILIFLGLALFLWIQDGKDQATAMDTVKNEKNHVLRVKNAQATINLILVNNMTETQLKSVKKDTNYLNLIDSL